MSGDRKRLIFIFIFHNAWNGVARRQEILQRRLQPVACRIKCKIYSGNPAIERLSVKSAVLKIKVKYYGLSIFTNVGRNEDVAILGGGFIRISLM